MTIVFYVAAAVAIIATLRVITALNAVHALLYFIVSLLAVAVILFALGAPFVAALEVIIYAGAIMVLFVFVVMTLNLAPQAAEQESHWLQPRMWIGPALLATALVAELIYAIAGAGQVSSVNLVEPRQVGMALFGPYLLGVELASLLLLAGLVGAYHLGRRERLRKPGFGQTPSLEAVDSRLRQPCSAQVTMAPQDAAPAEIE
jgi:NADH-quinone oxidoreductase subunit J